MRDILHDLIELQNQGVKGRFTEKGRKGGAGPADDKAFRIGQHTLMIPTLNNPAQHSDFAVLEEEDGRLLLKRDDKNIGYLEEVPKPKFYALRTKDGIPYRKIALLHGADCLASTVVQECIRYNEPKQRCRFCGIGVSLKSGDTIHTKTPEQLAEVAAAAKSLDSVTHVTLTSGTTDLRNKGAEYLGECAQAVKSETGLPIHVQFEPPEDRDIYRRLKEKGVDNVGIHIESFDPAVRKKVTPGKASIDEETYFRAFEDAVKVFGKNQVSTYVILGLGENEEITLDQCRRAIDIGVYPFLVPIRPILSTFMADFDPPDAGYLERIYEKVSAMMNEKGMDSEKSNSGCVKCKACSMQQFLENGNKGN